MKQTLLFIICCIVSGVSYAQIQAGSTFIGGTLGGSYDQPNPPAGKSSSFSFNPTAGRFLNQNWMVGVRGEFSQLSNDVNARSSYKSSDYTYHTLLHTITRQSFGIGPVVRYYQQLTPQLTVFAEGSLGYALTVNKRDYIDYATDNYEREVFNSSYQGNAKTHQLYAAFAPGLALFVTSKLSVELKANVLRYTHGLEEAAILSPVYFPGYHNSQRNFSANLTLATASIGVGYYF